MASRRLSASLYWRSRRDSPRAIDDGPAHRGANPPQALEARGPYGAPGGLAEHFTIRSARPCAPISDAYGRCRRRGREERAHRALENAARFPQRPQAILVLVFSFDKENTWEMVQGPRERLTTLTEDT